MCLLGIKQELLQGMDFRVELLECGMYVCVFDFFSKSDHIVFQSGSNSH